VTRLTVAPVRSRSDLCDFVDLPRRLHPRELAVPLLSSTIESWWRGTSPHPEPIELLLVRDASGATVGRTTVHTDARLDTRLGTPSLLFGATEFADDEAAGALLGAIQDRADGRSQLFGPVSLLPNQSGGVITSGFASRGFVDSPWNPARVPATYEALGFERWGESDTWLVEVNPSSRAAAPTAGEWEAAGLRLERGRRSQVARLVPEVLGVLNRSFAALPYYTTITDEEMAAATDGLGYLVDEDLLLLARDAVTGELVAFVLVVPDITSFVQGTGGRLGLLQQVRLLATRRRYRREAVLVIQGTDPARQGRGILTLLSRTLHANLAAGGYTRLRSTFVGRDNPASARQFERVGGRPLHGVTFYSRPVDRPDRPRRTA
jgi:GNAT superfamily N-acetyltransferase